MKNVYLIPTDKPSRLCLDRREDLIFYPRAGFSIADGKQHIYITSDEVIKEGDWYYLPRTNSIYKCQEDPIELNLERRLGVAKIILTTDADLIADGVQAIDDNFLEWFVKNPSCEFVEIKDKGYQKQINPEELKPTKHQYVWITDYEIIIPQEDINFFQLTVNAFQKSMNLNLECVEEPKQETTLEEAADIDSKNHYKDQSDYWAIGFDSFKRGAKWQAERMYSGEEVIAIVEKSRETGLTAEYLMLSLKQPK
jgi:hypothetical protein